MNKRGSVTWISVFTLFGVVLLIMTLVVVHFINQRKTNKVIKARLNHIQLVTKAHEYCDLINNDPYRLKMPSVNSDTGRYVVLLESETDTMLEFYINESFFSVYNSSKYQKLHLTILKGPVYKIINMVMKYEKI